MTSFIGGFALVYLMAIAAAEEVQFNVTPVQKLVDYQYNLDMPSVIPGLRYNGSIRANWAISNAALSGMDGKSITVKISATAQNNSSAFFLTPLGTDTYETEAYLRCDIANGSCANSSILFADIPVIVLIPLNSTSQEPKINLKSEIVDGINLPQLQHSAGGIFDSIAKIFSQNQSENDSASFNQSNSTDPFTLPFPSFGNGNSSDGTNFFDSLKPEGNSRDPIEFLKKNQLISLAALAIVVVITGAYLLNSKD